MLPARERIAGRRLRRVLAGAERSKLGPLDRTLMDTYLLSITNLQEQLLREVRASGLARRADGTAPRLRPPLASVGAEERE